MSYKVMTTSSRSGLVCRPCPRRPSRRCPTSCRRRQSRLLPMVAGIAGTVAAGIRVDGLRRRLGLGAPKVGNRRRRRRGSSQRITGCCGCWSRFRQHVAGERGWRRIFAISWNRSAVAAAAFGIHRRQHRLVGSVAGMRARGGPGQQYIRWISGTDGRPDAPRRYMFGDKL